MNDNEIIDLFFARDPQAIRAAKDTYGSYCGYVAGNLLQNRQDQEECLNDTWLHAWNAIPPSRPQHLGPFLGKITRNLALNHIRREQAQKRGGNVVQVAMEELEDCIPAAGDAYAALEGKQLSELLNRFLGDLPQEKRVAFVLRYYYGTSIMKIAGQLRCSESRVKSILHRTRKQLKTFLEQEGIDL